MDKPNMEMAMKLVAEVPSEDLGLAREKDLELSSLALAAMNLGHLDIQNRAITTLQLFRTAYLLGRNVVSGG